MLNWKNKALFLDIVPSIELAWASSAHAYRINKGYARETVQGYESDSLTIKYPAIVIEKCIVANQTLAHYAIMHPDILSKDDYRDGQRMLRQFSGLIFKGIHGNLGDWDKAVLSLVGRKDWNDTKNVEADFGILCALPKSFVREEKYQTATQIIARIQSKHIGVLNERRELSIRILRNSYSKRWETNFITAVTNTEKEENIVLFSCKKALGIDDSYNIKGTIKGHYAEGQTHLNRVQLNRVQVQ